MQHTGGVWSSDDPSYATINSGSGLVHGISDGTATIHYAYTGPNGCTAIATQDVAIVDLPHVEPITAPSGTQVCTSSTIPLHDATPGGTWASDNTAVATVSSTGVVTGVSNGTATISYSITTDCGTPPPQTINVTVNTAPSATISYSGSPFCTSVSGSVPVTLNGTSGGTYSYTGSGTLTLDTNTGAITPSTSTAGTYTITYSIGAAGGCSLFSNTTTVTITAAPSATISYTGGPFCTSAGPVSVTRTGTAGGTYSYTRFRNLVIKYFERNHYSGDKYRRNLYGYLYDRSGKWLCTVYH